MSVPVVCGLRWFEHYKANVRLILAASLLAVPLLVWLCFRRVILPIRLNS